MFQRPHLGEIEPKPRRICRIGISETALQGVSVNVWERIGGFTTTDGKAEGQRHGEQSRRWLTELHPVVLLRTGVGLTRLW
jgi:hypothetical protein